jgi:molybdopterin-containing oxidoreductase family iron-sulfur binding subunit
MNAAANAPGTSPPPSGGGASPGLTRRGFIGKGAAVLAGVSAVAAALSPLRRLDPRDIPTIEKLLQKHYKEMGPEERRLVLERIAAAVEKRYRVRPDVRDPAPLQGVEFVYGLNISRCIGCRRCVCACVKENNQSRSPQIQYIRVLKMEKGSIDLESSEHHYDPPLVPEHDSYYMPVQCHQCKKPPCVKVCPVEATWQEPDGITVIDYDWCIGCRYCEAACPYWARRFNFAEPHLPVEELNPHMAYLSNRPRTKGVMEKCTYCLHRVRKGRMPACVEVCPTGSRKFGNVLDPESEVSYILRQKRVFILKEDVGTVPRFFYYFDERGSRYREPITASHPGGPT